MSGYFGILHSTMDTFTARADAAEARTTAGQAQNSVERMQMQFDRLLLACEGMWSLLREKLGVTEEELLDRINAADLSDGKLDGKVRKAPVSCPACQRNLSPRFPTCMYCGEKIARKPFA